MLGAISSLASGLVGGDWWGEDKSKATTAGLLNSGGDLLGMFGSKLLGFGFGGNAEDKANAQIESMGKLQENALLNDLKYQEAKNLASQTNSLGLTGQAAALDAQRAMDKTGASASAINAANNMNAQAQSGLTGAASQANIAKITSQQQAGNMLDQARGMSGNPAAAMAMMNKIGQQMGQNNMAALGAANDAIAKANSTAIGAAGQASSLLDESAKTNFATNVSPHLTQTNANLNTATASIGAGGGNISSSAGGNDHLITNPLENLASMYQGDASGRQAFNQAFGSAIGARDAATYIGGGLLPDTGNNNPPVAPTSQANSGYVSSNPTQSLMINPQPAYGSLIGGMPAQDYINKRYGGYSFMPSH